MSDPASWTLGDLRTMLKAFDSGLPGDGRLSGGRLFEAYVHICGSDRVLADYQRHKLADRRGRRYTAWKTPRQVLRNESVFTTWLLLCGGKRQKTSQQRFSISYMMRFHGSSRLGLQLLYRSGCGISLTGFDRRWKALLVHHTETTRSNIVVHIVDCDITRTAH